MPFQLPDLPYAYDALEPHIDAETMRIHHDLHHKAYVDNANAALEGTEHADTLGRARAHDPRHPAADKQGPVRNNAGGHANHSLFWEIMGPDGGGEPTGDLARAIDDTFEGFDKLKAAVIDGGVKRFGSGWSWLVWDGTGLAVYSTREPGLADLAGPRAAARDRRVGARLLPQVPEQAPRLSRGLVERRQLGRGRRGATPRRAADDATRGAGLRRPLGSSVGLALDDWEHPARCPRRSRRPPASAAG